MSKKVEELKQAILDLIYYYEENGGDLSKGFGQYIPEKKKEIKQLLSKLNT